MSVEFTPYETNLSNKWWTSDFLDYYIMLHIVCRALFLVTSLNFTLIKPALDISIEHSTDVMDQVTFGYSTKNIPIPSEKDFTIELIKSVEKFVKNLKWRAFHYLNPVNNRQRKETYGFNTTSPPPKVDELNELKDMLYDLVVSIKFKKHSNEFQSKLKEDIRNIARESKMYIAADKTNNFYKVPKEMHEELLKKQIQKDYKKTDESNVKEITKKDKDIASKLEIEELLKKQIQKDYKKTDESKVKDITKKDKDIASKLEIDDRVYTTAKRQSCITLKETNRISKIPSYVDFSTQQKVK